MSTTPIADMITEMLKNCIPLEMIIAAVRSMERAMSTRHPVDETAEKRRAWDREYRRNKRAPRPPDPPDIHPNPPDVGNAAISSLEEERSYSKEEKKEGRGRGSKLPPDWKPKPQHYDEGAKRGMSPFDVDERATSMREWCEANSNRSITTKANWDAAFMGAWIKQGNRNGNGTRGNRTYPTSGPTPTGDDAVVTGMARALQRRRDARAATDGDREFRGRGDAAGASDAEPTATEDDAGSHRQLACLPRSNAG